MLDFKKIEKLILYLMANIDKYSNDLTDIIERYMIRHEIEYGSKEIDFYTLDEISYNEIILLTGYK